MEDRAPAPSDRQFRHEALFYKGADDFLAGTLPFIRDGVAADEPILVALDERKIRLLRHGLGADADRVRFVDMADLGRNPACILPAWRDFVTERKNRSPIRGIGEPVWRGRSDAELTECDHHESLLNLAFAETADFTLLCPYDVEGLEPDVLGAARRNHPLLTARGETTPSDSYLGPEEASSPFEGPLPQPASESAELPFEGGHLGAVRRFVWAQAQKAGMDATRQADVALAVNELSSNSVRHGGGGGLVRVWSERDALLCEVSDRGRISDPLAGRARPEPTQLSGRGLWIVNQLCDLVQIRSGAGGSVVRIRLDLN